MGLHVNGAVCKWGCPYWKRVASERAKRTHWLVAATKLFVRCYLVARVGGSDKESC